MSPSRLARIARIATAGLLAATLAATLAVAQPPARTVGRGGSRPREPRAVTDSGTVMSMVRALAAPKMEGRGAGTAGLDSAAALIAGEMRWLGLRPGGEDGTYFQPFEVTTGVEVGEPCAVTAGGRGFPVGEAFQPLGFSSNGTLRASVVFAGYGITAPGYDYDDYAGIDPRY